jgi:hypothetical protein
LDPSVADRHWADTEWGDPIDDMHLGDDRAASICKELYLNMSSSPAKVYRSGIAGRYNFLSESVLRLSVLKGRAEVSGVGNGDN